MQSSNVGGTHFGSALYMYPLSAHLFTTLDYGVSATITTVTDVLP